MRRAAVLLSAIVVLTSCSAALSPAATEDLQDRAAAVRRSAEARDPGAAAAELDGLRAAVARWFQAGELDRARAEAILAAADDVGAALSLLPGPAPEPPPAQEPEEEAREPEEDHDGDDDDNDDDEKDDDDSSGPGSGGSGGGDGGSGPG